MRISLPSVCIGDSPVRYINYTPQNGNFTIPSHIEVTIDGVLVKSYPGLLFFSLLGNNALNFNQVKTPEHERG